MARTTYDRAAQMASGSNLTIPKYILVDKKALHDCEQLHIFHRGHSWATCPTLSQWIYDQMIKAIKEELKKKGLE